MERRSYMKMIDQLRDAGHRVVLQWEMKGPQNTQVKWMAMYQVGPRLVFFQDFEDDGFDYFIQTQWNDLTSCLEELTKVAEA